MQHRPRQAVVEAVRSYRSGLVTIGMMTPTGNVTALIKDGPKSLLVDVKEPSPDFDYCRT
jgi:hypothetical protein